MPRPCIIDLRLSLVHTDERMDRHEGISLKMSRSVLERGEAFRRDNVCDSVCYHADKKDIIQGDGTEMSLSRQQWQALGSFGAFCPYISTSDIHIK